MFKNYLQSIDGIEIYPIISLVVFFLFFIIMTIYVIGLKKRDMSLLSNIPFTGEDEFKTSIQKQNK
ncbi:MAG: CcoQ/FixQ family Cbb3-type cytochrome c oxidase assembly chaperone [Bacteroidetes bacterium]|nr:MAG: CcoQ/FixQ family Cbb3-type cytochrome c oxidase assembly chaperone [Bacteroidota bacterium]REK05273.1 MAG: CcoQ/FixQ family Cbb3-type cytochrome c oxidase assembly chaperone [Bacteroidota bacterium]REK32678.1 MAG: CcoQ/FixQ family Cbb3-type cytochrome c oxidase assembly chaperone [Bacteroidota bacterium]REK48875.1 MAG: CcoQ/FixQ family Cbb3-type cytochrome c oxidase assembly chaperone [Bacteroidota bacterium]